MQLQDSPRLVRTVRKGFTLIELVVVILIIAIIAGLVIPQVANLGRSADMAASAKTQADLANNVQLHFVLQKRFPQGLDTLTDGTAIYASDTSDATTQVRGLPYAGADGTRLQAQLDDWTVDSTDTTGQWYRSFTRAGFDYVFHHDTTVVNSNNSAVTRFPTTGNFPSAGTVVLAEVVGAYMRGKLCPQGLDTTRERLVALGVGPNMAAIGKTLTNSPIYPGCDGRYYGRYILYFKVYATGERATLVGCSDSYGRTPDYTQQQFNESLPDGGRQG